MSEKEVSLSVNESNALREKLGLKKLNEGAEKKRHETVRSAAEHKLQPAAQFLWTSVKI